MPPLSSLLRLTLVASLFLPSTAVMSFAADGPAPAPAPDGGEIELIAPDALSEADWGFHQLLAQALLERDAGLVTDLALQSVHAEKVLLRSIQGFSSKDLFATAIHLAGTTGDVNSLQRLQKAAERDGQTELAQRIVTLAKLSSESRAAGGEPAEEIIPVLPEDIQAYHSLLDDVSRAALVNDQELVDSVKFDLAKLDWLSEQHKKTLLARLDAAMSPEAAAPPEVLSVMNRLTASSRGWSSLPRIPIPPRPPFPPITPLPGDQIEGRRSFKVYFENTSSYTISVAYSLKPSSGQWNAYDTLQGWTILPPGSSRMVGNNWGPKFYWCAVAMPHRNPNIKHPVWWAGSEMRGAKVGTLKSEGFRQPDLGRDWRDRQTFTVRID